MTSLTNLSPTPPLQSASRTTYTTTLYNLMSSLQAQFGPEDEDMVTAVAIHILRSGQLTFSGHRAEIMEAPDGKAA